MSSSQDEHMPNDELRYFASHYMNSIKDEMAKLSREIADLKQEVKTINAIREATEAMANEVKQLREREIADIRCLLAELRGTVKLGCPLIEPKGDVAISPEKLDGHFAIGPSKSTT